MTLSHTVRGVDHAAFLPSTPRRRSPSTAMCSASPWSMPPAPWAGPGPAPGFHPLLLRHRSGRSDRVLLLLRPRALRGPRGPRADQARPPSGHPRRLRDRPGRDRRRLDASSWPCELQVRHETVESIYVTDPNGYLIEVTRPLRAITLEDDIDANLSVDALMAVVDDEAPSLQRFFEIKADLIAERYADEPAGVSFV